ncbi:filamentous haemagglutinin family protein [Caulobacter sp.]|uniref:filamentous haemagglutinin family protein n=1 Tax=Caulobacter sp. TaxID=78 RepID=UPI003BB03D2C
MPNGLGAGGLAPVANPNAFDSGAGLNLWKGANLPTQTTNADGSILVDVKQTESRAILSWETFNVGRNTTLNFDQSINGAAQRDWIVVNRVVGRLDPSTGLRSSADAPAPSRVLGAIKAPGTVLVINQNGVIFGAGAQVNTGSLLASTLEIGRATRDVNSVTQTLSIADRNDEFLTFGLFGVERVSTDSPHPAFSRSPLANPPTSDPLLNDLIQVEAGAQIISDKGGYVILAGPKVSNAGLISSNQGQVSLVAGSNLFLAASSGAPDSIDPNIRGLSVDPQAQGPTGFGTTQPDAALDYAENKGIIHSAEGYASVTAPFGGAAINSGIITATTSVSRNGFVQLDGKSVQLATGGVIAITPEDQGSIPRDFKSLSDFKTSKIKIGDERSSIEIASNSLIYAPSANVEIGAAPGETTQISTEAIFSTSGSRVFVDSNAVIDVSGLKDVQIAASRNSIKISPVKGNELADSPGYRDSFLNGATLYLDPRLSGVRSDGAAWIGSPLVSAASYAEQVGVTASELMTKGGNVSLGVVGKAQASGLSTAPDVIVKRGAQIDISGGWVSYQAGMVRTSKLVDITGAVVDVGEADPDNVYIGLYSGFIESQPRFGLVRTFANPLLTSARYAAGYSEGRDAGSLTIKSSQPLLEGTIYADAFPGEAQKQTAQIGNGKPTVYGDHRALQGAASQLPVGGLLKIQALSLLRDGTTSQSISGGGDIRIVAGEAPVLGDGLNFGQSVSIGADGLLITPARPADSVLPLEDHKALLLGADTLSHMGLGQLSLSTSGALTVEEGADLVLSPGGIFEAVAGRTLRVDGSITAASGRLSLETIASQGSLFAPTGPAGPGDYDLIVNGTLSTAGLWVNDFGAKPGALQGSAHIDGGSIRLKSAPRMLVGPDNASTTNPSAPSENIDISGSILLNGPNTLIDVSSGGYVAPDGTLNLTAKGGDVSLINETTYFQIGVNGTNTPVSGGVTGVRGGGSNVAINPAQAVARVAIGEGAIRGNGFGGGGTFSLTTPKIELGEGEAPVGTRLALDFFSKAGFANYEIKSYGTSLTPNTFDNGLGGYNAVLATQTLTIGDGQVLNLSQSRYASRLDAGQVGALRALESGGRISDILQPTIQPEAWDQLAVNLSFSGLVELKVAQGGQVLGAAGSSIGASRILNQGLIRLAGGSVVQTAALPEFYTRNAVVSGRSLSDLFSTGPDGVIDPTAMSVAKPAQTNAQLAATGMFYLLGELDADVGVQLDPGSVTDLSGTSIRNPYAQALTRDGRQVVTGRVVAGGSLTTAVARPGSGNMASDVSPFTNSVYSGGGAYPSSLENRLGLDFKAASGATLDLSGANDIFDQPGDGGLYAPAAQWSAGGSLVLGAGGTFGDATILARGGAAQAAGGMLVMPDLVLTAAPSTSPVRNTLAASRIEASGFDTLVVRGSLNSADPDVSLKLGSAFYLTSKPWDGRVDLSSASVRQSLSPTLGAGGALRISAPYISLAGDFQTLNTPLTGVAGSGQITFDAQAMDVSGAVLFDRSVAKTTFNVVNDLRLTGVTPYQTRFDLGGTPPSPSLVGQLAVNGDLSIVASQVYATTGSTFTVSSAGVNGQIAIGRSSAQTPTAPYSAGSTLNIQAANIVQGGVLRAPLGTLNLGTQAAPSPFAPATTSLVLADGSVTSVSAEGLSIPYGVTTDQREYYFTPTTATPLTGPPTGVLNMAGNAITTEVGATIDLSGGGDVYAYEFIPGPGGSRDVLSQFNPDAFSGNDGYQYADHRQVYAVVPGLSNAQLAAYDPIYSANYGALQEPSGAGRRVYLDAAPGLAAGWYTLLPAQYAMLPGGVRVVENTDAATVVPGSSFRHRDGSLSVAGRYGGLGGAEDSRLRVFNIQDQSVIRSYSNLALTSANTSFADQALRNGTAAPRLPLDAARLTFAPTSSLVLQGAFRTAPAKGGRGAQADITGERIAIVSDVGAPIAGVVQLDADQLSSLNVESLMIGGLRTDLADGTTNLRVTAREIRVSNDAAHPLAAPDILLAVDRWTAASTGALIVENGAAITARGVTSDTRTGDYVINGASALTQSAQGAVLRVSNGPQRAVSRTNVVAAQPKALLDLGAATLSAGSVLLESNGDFAIDPGALIAADDLTLNAAEIHFTDTFNGQGGLVVSSSLLASLGAARTLTLRTPSVIDFSAGEYQFGDAVFNASGIAVAGGVGAVSVKADSLVLTNSQAQAAACTISGPLACGAGEIALQAKTLAFGSGDLRLYGAGQGLTLVATTGLFYEGKGSLDAGAAPLSIQTPLIADRAAKPRAGVAAVVPALSLTTTGAVTISGAGSPSALPEGVAGSALTIAGDTLTVTGSTLRATSGSLKLVANGALTVGAGAVLSTPGYAKTFGDAADPYQVSAPGGTLTLTSVSGDVDLASGSTLSVGGGAGEAGDLVLNAARGAVRFNGALDFTAPGGGGGFALNEAGAFDLSTFQTIAGGFTGDIAVQTGTGDLTLAAGQTLKAGNLTLVADGGRVDIGGKIDVSGVNGGAVRLTGADGVTLRGGSTILARATGYDVSATRVAEGGLVLLGTSGAGDIDVQSGAIIDVGAAHDQARLVRTRENGVTNYRLVDADRGGEVILRAPALGPDGAQTVDVRFAGTINGADSIVLEGFKAYDLGQVASSGMTGVTITNNVATLDLRTAGTNFLASIAPGTVPYFVRNFDVSASYGDLGGLAGLGNFHARPGIELDYSGSIVLASNWNLGAGTVNVAGAVSAGLMAAHPQIAGAFYVKAGSEGRLLSDFTDMTYRVDGRADGEAPGLTVRAGGDLTLRGSITDGFFTFGDQTDPAFLSIAIGEGSRVYNGFLAATCTGTCQVPNFTNVGPVPTQRINFALPATLVNFVTLDNPAPYRAAANTAAALGSGTGGAGDPIASADLFPLIDTGTGPRPMASSSLQLTAGAARDAGGAFSADPTRLQAGVNANLIMDGRGSYTYADGAAGTATYSNTLLLKTSDSRLVPASQWLAAQLAANPGLTTESYTVISLGSAPAAFRTALQSYITSYFAGQPASSYVLTGAVGARTQIATTLGIAAGFWQLVAANWATLKSGYPAQTSTNAASVTVPTAALLRTGAGSIGLAAAGNVDLRNGASVVYRNASTGLVGTAANGYQMGGAAVYTAGHRVDPKPITVADPDTGDLITLDPSAYSAPIARKTDYLYGSGAASVANRGVAGGLQAEVVYADGGGDITVTAGADLLGRRDPYGAMRATTNATGLTFVGGATQPWRVGAVGPITDIRINNKLFTEGLGALGGGDIRVSAGNDVSDISLVADTSVTTADVGGRTGKALMTFGGGDVALRAGGDLLGGRIDIGRGDGDIVVGGDILAAGLTQRTTPSSTRANTLRLRLTDAQIDVSARGDTTLQGVAALGVGDINRIGFYSGDSGVSLLTGGALRIENAATNLNNTDDVITNGGASNTSSARIAAYPASFTAVALNGDLSIAPPDNNPFAALLYPSARGTLTLAAGGDINRTALAMLDNDPGLTPGAFTSYINDGLTVTRGLAFVFPAVLPDTSLANRYKLHAESVPHLGDTTPNRIYADGDIEALTLSSAKATRVSAGRDIVDMMFFGQNLSPTDITRITAGRDITATTTLRQGFVSDGAGGTISNGLLPTLNGNTFVLGGPGHLFLEAGRDLGPFLTSAVELYLTPNGSVLTTYGGGVMTVGSDWNPWLGDQGASIVTAFGVGKGSDYAALRETYLKPAANGGGTQPPYAQALIDWMRADHADALGTTSGNVEVDYAQAYQAFAALPDLQQRIFLLQVYFNELTQTSIPGPSYLKYSRGYAAVNTLFPASLGYTANDLTGGSNGANSRVRTGDLDLRLATIQTARGGDISILGPGGDVLAGSTVATAQQAARRNFIGGALYGAISAPSVAQAITEIPAGFEGVLTLRGGKISAFTDGDFVLNQSRLFTEQGGDIAMWSSNGDLNAGQGPKTSSSFPPVRVKIDTNGYATLDQASSVTGAGIAAFQPAPGVTAPNVYLIAPRGTVDAGDAGVRVAGNLFVAALSVSNADNFSVQGATIGVPNTTAAPTVGADTAAASNAATKLAQQAATARPRDDRSIITVEVLGFGEAP